MKTTEMKPNDRRHTMKTKTILATALVCTLAITTTQAQQVPLPKTPAEVLVAGTVLTKEYVQMVAHLRLDLEAAGHRKGEMIRV
jgi:hypothetical protein